MKKLILFLILFNLTIFNLNAVVINVGIYDNAPKLYMDEHGEAAGFWVDLTKLIIIQTDYELNWIYGSWDECLQMLEQGKIDLLPDVGFTENRAKKFLFANETTLLSWSRLYVHKDSECQTLLDLNGQKVGALKNSFNLSAPEGLLDLINQFRLDCEVVEYDDYNSVFEAIGEKEIFAGITNKDFGASLETSFPVKRTPIIFQPADLRYAFSKRSIHSNILMPIFDKYIKTYKADSSSEYQTLIDKHFGMQHNHRFIPYWLKFTLFILLILSLISLVFIILLRYKVKLNTHQLQQKTEEWEKTFNTINDLIWILDSDQKIIRVNNPPQPVIDLDIELVMGKPCYEVVHHQDCPIDGCPLPKSRKSLTRETMELAIGDKWVQVIVDPFVNAEGKFGGAVHIIKDITENKLIMEELIDSNGQLATSEKELRAMNVDLQAHDQELNAMNQQLAAHENQLLDTNMRLSKEIGINNEVNIRLKEELQTKKALFEEIFHRTKNNMQIISSMLTYETRRNKDEVAKSSFMNVQNKIYAMSLVQTQLYQSGNLSQINLKDFILDYNQYLFKQPKLRELGINMKTDLEDVYILIDTALPASLVYNELISNIFQHAFPNPQQSEISISLKDVNGEVQWEIGDNGIGIPLGINLEQSKSLGLQTAYSLIQDQLKGNISYENSAGLHWSLRFKDNLHKRRV